MGKLVNSSGEEIFVFPGSVGIDSLPEERLTVAGNISSTGNLSAGDIVGTWCGTTLSSSQVTVDSSDLKAYDVTEGLFLKSIFQRASTLLKLKVQNRKTVIITPVRIDPSNRRTVGSFRD